MPLVLDLAQGSPEWLAHRQKGIGASELANVLEENPFKGGSAFDLWLLKRGLRTVEDNDAMRHGRDNEAAARDAYCSKFNLDFPPVVFQHNDFPWLFASLDGWNEEERHIVEIKSPKSSDLYKRALEGDIPRYYAIQMVQQIMVAEAKSCDFWVWDAPSQQGACVPFPIGEPLQILDGMSVEEYWYVVALPALEEFWRRVVEGVWPPLQSSTHRIEDAATLAEFVRLAGERTEAQEVIKSVEDRKDATEAALKRLAGGAKTTSGGGYRASWFNFKPKYIVQVELANDATAAQLLEKLTANIGAQPGVLSVKRADWAPRLDFRVTKEK